MKVSIRDLKQVYEEEIKKNVKNKRKLFAFERYKMEYFIDIKEKLENNLYDGGLYHVFLVYQAKVRVIMSQDLYDKIINHYVTRFILIPKLERYLCKENVVTRKKMGTRVSIQTLLKNIEYYKKYETIYALKMDLKKYFYTIDHEIVKELLKKELTREEYKIVCAIIDSTNQEYINKKIEVLQKKVKEELPRYLHGKGLPIGNMTSQLLAIFYLYKVHYFMIHSLKLKPIIYMDDYLIFHSSKEYLKECKERIIEKFLEYKMDISDKKTYITRLDNGINFLGYHFKVVNKKTVIHLSKSTKKQIQKGIKRNLYLYKKGKISFQSFFCSMETYKGSYLFVKKDQIEHLFNRYWVIF